MTSIGGLDGQSRVLFRQLRLDKQSSRNIFVNEKVEAAQRDVGATGTERYSILACSVKIKGELFWNVFNGSMVPGDIVSKYRL